MSFLIFCILPLILKHTTAISITLNNINGSRKNYFPCLSNPSREGHGEARPSTAAMPITLVSSSLANNAHRNSVSVQYPIPLTVTQTSVHWLPFRYFLRTIVDTL